MRKSIYLYARIGKRFLLHWPAFQIFQPVMRHNHIVQVREEKKDLVQQDSKQTSTVTLITSGLHTSFAHYILL